MKIKSLVLVALSSIILFACKKDEFDTRYEELIMNGQTVRSWEITKLVSVNTGEDLLDSLLADCEKDNFYSFYENHKYEEHDNDVTCISDTSGDIVDEGLWSITTDELYFDILSADALTKESYQIVSISSEQLVMDDTTNAVRYTLNAK